MFKDRGLIVPVSTIYTLFRKQSKGISLTPQPRHRRQKYTDEDARIVVEAQKANNHYRYEERNVWRAQRPDRTDSPSNYVIHNMLTQANITTKNIVPVPVARNEPHNITDRHNYSKKAIGWDRSRLVFIDETTFSKGLHQTRGRSERGTVATMPVLNSSGVGMKVCAAVSPSLGSSTTTRS